MGLSGPIRPGANRGTPRWGVAPSHVQGARTGVGAAGRGTTASAPATCTDRAVSGRTAIPCPATPKVSRTRRSCHQHPRPAVKTGPPDSRLERHRGEDVGGRDAIGIRLRLGDNPVADSAADTRAVRRSGITPHRDGDRGRRPHARPPRERDARGDRRGAGPPLAGPWVIPGVCWLPTGNGSGASSRRGPIVARSTCSRSTARCEANDLPARLARPPPSLSASPTRGYSPSFKRFSRRLVWAPGRVAMFRPIPPSLRSLGQSAGSPLTAQSASVPRSAARRR